MYCSALVPLALPRAVIKGFISASVFSRSFWSFVISAPAVAFQFIQPEYGLRLSPHRIGNHAEVLPNAV
jgi:hypothetical protein